MDAGLLLKALWIVLLSLPLLIWIGMRMAGRLPRTRILILLASVGVMLLAVDAWLTRGL